MSSTAFANGRNASSVPPEHVLGGQALPRMTAIIISGHGQVPGVFLARDFASIDIGQTSSLSEPISLSDIGDRRDGTPSFTMDVVEAKGFGRLEWMERGFSGNGQACDLVFKGCRLSFSTAESLSLIKISYRRLSTWVVDASAETSLFLEIRCACRSPIRPRVPSGTTEMPKGYAGTDLVSQQLCCFAT